MRTKGKRTSTGMGKSMLHSNSSPAPSYCSSSSYCAYLIALVIIFVAAYLTIHGLDLLPDDERDAPKNSSSSSSSSSTISIRTSSFVPAAPQYVDTGTVKFTWQQNLDMDVKGVIYLLHGCDYEPGVWWKSSKNCEKMCNGMPAELKIANTFVKSGYAIFSIGPSFSKCWAANDRVFISEAAKTIYSKLNTTMSQTPLYALGIGNGGVFLGNYVKSMVESFGLKFAAIALMNTGIWHNNFNRKHHPAVLFICMNRNGNLCVHNDHTVDTLMSKGIKAKQVTVDPLTLTPTSFHQSDEDGLTEAESSTLYDVLHNNSYLWAHNSLLLVDPHQPRNLDTLRDLAEMALPTAIPSKDDMMSKHSAVLQLLRIAWGFKETSYETSDSVIQWFEAHG
jgi:hypothetical protein